MMTRAGEAFKYDPDTSSSLHPEHVADLAKSGLSAATISELNIHTIPPRWIGKHLGFDNQLIESVLCFPYPGHNGFCRDKIFPLLKGESGHSTRYLQRTNSGSHLYIPSLAREALNNPNVALSFTEGEKKAAKACQEGLPCIGLGGLWNWVQDGKPISELDLIVWQERHVVLIPDSDVWSRQDLLHAVYALGAELEKRGAYIRVLRLPSEGETKLDDLLVRGGREALLGCEQIALSSLLFAEAHERERRRQERLANGHIDIEEDEEGEQSEALPAFPEAAWRGPFKTYRDAMSGTTEAADVHHFAALWNAAAARLRRRVRMSYGMALYPNVYLVTFGPTGDRKTTAARGALSLLPDGVPVKVLQGVGSGEGLGDWFSTESSTPISHLLFLEELSELLARGKWDGATLLSFLTHVFDCPSKYELKFRKNPINLVEPTLSFLACTTPALFWHHMREVDIHSGFGNRLLYMTGPVKEPIPLPAKPNLFKIGEVHKALARLDDLKPQEANLELDAQTLWGQFYKIWRETELDSLTKAATERVPAYCLKLAMVFAALEETLPTVTEPQIKASIAVGRYATKCTELLMGHNRQASVQGRCEQIVRRVLQEKSSWLSRRQLWQRVSGRFDSGQFGKALNGMVAAGEIEAVDGARKGQTLYRIAGRRAK